MKSRLIIIPLTWLEIDRIYRINKILIGAVGWFVPGPGPCMDRIYRMDKMPDGDRY